MKKKLVLMFALIALLALVLSIALTACGEEKNPCEHVNRVVLEDIVPATCKSGGRAKFVCNDCGAEFEAATELDPHAHVYTRVLRKLASCEEAGEYYWECEICHESFVTYIEAYGHEEGEWQPAEEGGATCTEPGTIEIRCTHCDEVLDSKYVAALGHIELPAVETETATCQKHGKAIVSCERCGEVLREETTPIADHVRVPVETYVAPTCTRKGRSAGEMCSVCNQVFEQPEDLPIIAHHYEKGVCTECSDEKVFTAKFVALGEVVGDPIEFTVSTVDALKKSAPPVPEHPGCEDGAWAWWGDDDPVFDGDSDEITINAEYRRPYYSINYDLEGNLFSGGELVKAGVKNYNPRWYHFGDEAFDLQPLEYPGYRFLGWYEGGNYDDEQCKVESFDPSQDGFEFRTYDLRAKWEFATYTIKYEGEGFDSSGDEYIKTYNIGSTTFTLPTLEKTGYTFNGWSDGQSVRTQIETGSYGDLTLSPAFTPIDYEITYKNDFGVENPNPKTYNIESATTPLSPIERAGYKFTGWTSNGEPKGSITRGEYGPLELTATWEREEYSITYQNCEGVDTSSFPSSYNIESDAIELPTLNVPCYDFEGWLKDGEKVTHIRKGSYGNVTLTASLTPHKFTIKLDENGGTLLGGDASVNFGENYSLEVPTRTGYEFLGWFTGREAGAAQLTDANGLSIAKYDWADDVTMSAQWKIRTYTVTFDTGEGSSKIEEKKFEYNSQFVLPEEPKRTDFFFAGWYDESGDVEYTSSSRITSDVTMHAKWVNSISIKDADGLRAIKDAPDKDYHLENDIDLRGERWEPIPEFSGTLNGRGFTIENFVLSSTNPGENFGFFAVNNGTLKDFTISNFNINVTTTDTGHVNVGGLVGRNGPSGVIQNIVSKSTSDVTRMFFTAKQLGRFINASGGLVGRNEGKVSFCTQVLDLTLYLGRTDTRSSEYNLTVYSGSMIGYNGGEISNCSSEGSILYDAKTIQDSNWGQHYNVAMFVGSLVGYNGGAGTLIDSNATASISGNYRETTQYSSRVGVAVGKNDGLVKNCFSMGEITGNYHNYIGGLAGFNATGARIECSYSSVVINANVAPQIGGLVGYNSSVIQNCYATGDVKCAANSQIGGLVGYNSSTGSVFKCFTMNDVTVPGGSAGYLIGQNDGLLQTSYYSQGNSIVFGGQYVENTGDSKVAYSIERTKIWTEEFLYGTLYWDVEGWVILTDSNPRLDWELTVGHNFVIQEIAPNCLEDGFSIYSCRDCGLIFVKDYIPALGHQYHTDSVIPATCFTDGYTKMVCDVCGDELHDAIIPTTGHPQGKVTVRDGNHRATCEDAGYIIYHCDECSSDFRVEEEPLGHKKNGAYIERQEPTCTVEGKEVYNCATCGQPFEVVLNCIEHTWVPVEYKAPTCGVVYADDGSIDRDKCHPEAGHEAGRWCSVCHEIQFGLAPIEPHIFELKGGKYEKDPTCTTEGIGVYVCKTCQYEVRDDHVPMIAHTDAKNDFICDVCGQTTFTNAQLQSFTHIKEVKDFDLIRQNPAGNYWLDANINLSGEKWEPIGTKQMPFFGIFFGADHIIEGLTFDVRDQSDVSVLGLFAYNSGQILNVKLGGYTLNTYNADVVFGGIAAYNDGDIRNCQIVGDKGNCVINATVELIVTDYSTHERIMAGSTIGGFVGVNNGLLESSKVNTNIFSTFVNNSEIRSDELFDFLASLIKSTSATTEQRITLGGLAGENRNEIVNCSVTGTVRSEINLTASLSFMRGKAYANSYFYAGSAVGYNSGNVTGCSVLAKMEHNLLNRDVKENAPSLFNGKLYEMGYSYHNASPLEGIDGVAGHNDKTSTFECRVLQ